MPCSRCILNEAATVSWTRPRQLPAGPPESGACSVHVIGSLMERGVLRVQACLTAVRPGPLRGRLLVATGPRHLEQRNHLRYDVVGLLRVDQPEHLYRV